MRGEKLPDGGVPAARFHESPRVVAQVQPLHLLGRRELVKRHLFLLIVAATTVTVVVKGNAMVLQVPQAEAHRVRLRQPKALSQQRLDRLGDLHGGTRVEGQVRPRAAPTDDARADGANGEDVRDEVATAGNGAPVPDSVESLGQRGAAAAPTEDGNLPALGCGSKGEEPLVEAEAVRGVGEDPAIIL